jgi:hypothetical protein
VIWRSVIVAGYGALAILVGIAYGGQGLAILFYFYFCAGAWVAFLLVWNWAARAAGRWNYERLDRAPPGRERNGSRPDKGEAGTTEHDHLSLQPNSLTAARPQEGKPVLAR